jgi:hypothetical protein
MASHRAVPINTAAVVVEQKTAAGPHMTLGEVVLQQGPHCLYRIAGATGGGQLHLTTGRTACIVYGLTTDGRCLPPIPAPECLEQQAEASANTRRPLEHIGGLIWLRHEPACSGP